MLLKRQVKKLGFQRQRFFELWHEEESLRNILSDNYNIRLEKEKIVGTMSEKLEMTSNYHFFKIFI